MEDDIFKGLGVEVELIGEDSFLKIRETLTRIGIASRKEKRLVQTCHILHKRGKYAIMHFKELFEMDGKTADFTEEDKGRRNTITNLLEEWELIKVVDPSKVEDPVSSLANIKVLPHKDKSEWQLEAKYTIGNK